MGDVWLRMLSIKPFLFMQKKILKNLVESFFKPKLFVMVQAMKLTTY